MTGGVRMLSVDIDGTILFDRAISPADVAAMRRWREAGNLLVMNTGRSISALRSALDGFDVDYDYAVLYTGAVLTDGRAGVIEARTLPDGLIEEILDVLGREERITIFATTLAGDLQLHDTLGSSTDLLTLFRRGTTADLAGRAVVGIPLHLKTAAATDRIEAEVARRWGGVIEGARNQDFLDLIPAGASKGAGLSRLVDLLTGPGGAHEGETIETWTVGDSWNDIPMHVAADHGVAMEGSPAEVLAACERRTPSVASLVEDLLAAG